MEVEARLADGHGAPVPEQPVDCRQSGRAPSLEIGGVHPNSRIDPICRGNLERTPACCYVGPERHHGAHTRRPGAPDDISRAPGLITQVEMTMRVEPHPEGGP